MLSHPGITKLYEIYESESQIYMINDYLQGGELFDKIQSKGNYSEADAMKVMKMMLEVVSYIHSKQIIHRDLKPENIILT